MKLLNWIEQELKPKVCNSEEFFYDEMESQSDYCLPIIYQPFDASKKAHWRDRGSLFDYLLSTNGEGKKLLDFGPGDGWPSLIVAPFVREVIGVEGSHRRINVCSENAKHLGISNARFIYVEPGKSLPFPDNTFDGVMAASSVEQTPDPGFTLNELFRVLRPGGRLRINYEALGMYRNGKEQEVLLDEKNKETCRLIIYDRNIEKEYARMYSIMFEKPCNEIMNYFSRDGNSLSLDMLTIPLLEKLKSAITEARFCSLTHPSGRTFLLWLKDIGFRKVISTHSGAWFAGQLFDQFSEENRPKDMDTIDKLLKPLVKIVVQMKAPIGDDPMITAVK